MNTNDLIQKYILVLEKLVLSLEGQTKTQKEKLKSLEKDLEQSSLVKDKEIHSLSEELNKRDSLIWRLGLAVISDDKETIMKLGEAVSKMREQGPDVDMETIVDSVYSSMVLSSS